MWLEDLQGAMDEKHFDSHIPCGMWRDKRWFWQCRRNFYSHIPCGMWHKRDSYTTGILVNFYSHIPCGMWLSSWRKHLVECNFYSHIPCGMWHFQTVIQSNFLRFLLTHPVWDVTQKKGMTEAQINFYSHIPCGMWHRTWGTLSGTHGFLLTHPVWDVTTDTLRPEHWQTISTHTSRVGCDLITMMKVMLR